MRESYNELCSFNFGKRCYVVMKNFDKIVYFESSNGKYVMPITSFNLYDNEGKSMTLVNQHFFMDQLVNRINIALGKGYFRNDQEIIDYLNSIKSSSESDLELKKMFKGTMMGDINSENFEMNKRNILKYLDKFNLETYVDYNSVSIFNGSLEKNSLDSGVSNEASNLTNIDYSNFDFKNDDGVESDEDNNIESNVSVESSVSDVSNVDNISQDDIDVIDIVESESQDNEEKVDFDFIDSNNYVVDEKVDSVNSSDYFSSIGKSIEVSNRNGSDIIDSSDSNLSNVDIIEESIDNSDISSVNNLNSSSFYDIPQAQVVDNLNVSDNSNLSMSSDMSNGQVSDNGLNDFNNILSDLDNSSSVELNSSTYIDEVKNRIQSNNTLLDSNNSNLSNYSNEFSTEVFVPNENVDLNNKVISDKNDLPEIGDSLDSGSIEIKEKKSKVGLVVFFIILIVMLIVISYFLYIYVF